MRNLFLAWGLCSRLVIMDKVRQSLVVSLLVTLALTG
jgi:hypothetical protein